MKYTFVTGMGRSGTKFLAELLATSQGCKAQHECIGNREFWLLSWYMDSRDYALAYLQQERQRIEASANGAAVFVDVNSYLRNAVPALREVFDAARIFHLVRDPRKVIPSIYARRSERDVQEIPREPAEIQWWLESDKFEHVCWNWAQTTRRLMQEETTTIRLEDIVDDFDYVVDRLARPTGINIDKASWDGMKCKKTNRTRSRLYRYLYARLRGETYVQSLPPYEKWSPAQRDTYQRICGELATELGYE